MDAILTASLIPITGANKPVEKFLTAAQVARRFNVTARTVVRWIADGDLSGAFQANPEIKNSPFLIPIAAVEALEKKKQELLSEANDDRVSSFN